MNTRRTCGATDPSIVRMNSSILGKRRCLVIAVGRDAHHHGVGDDAAQIVHRYGHALLSSSSTAYARRSASSRRSALSFRAWTPRCSAPEASTPPGLTICGVAGRKVVPAGSVAKLRAVDLQDAGLRRALGDQQHDRRRPSPSCKPASATGCRAPEQAGLPVEQRARCWKRRSTCRPSPAGSSSSLFLPR